jgi:nicotinamidase-related amidase
MRIKREDTAGLVIDIQEKLFPHMDRHEELLRKCSQLIEGLKILGVPLLVTEQYPKGLGPTIREVSTRTSPFPVIEKMAFSCCDEPAVLEHPVLEKRQTVLVFGIEAHVCVLQTVIDLAENGYQAVVVADCISSRSREDKQLAVERMRSEGAVITSCESILLELARVSGTDEFKAISRLIK